MERQDFYHEQIAVYKETGSPSKSVEIVNVILFNESGELIIQKRAGHKRHNPNLLDKSIGGHIQNGDDPNYSVMVETVQELEVPSLVARNFTEFMKAYKLLETYIKSIALIQYVDTKTLEYTRIFDKESVVIASRVHFYIWVYGGRIKNIDKEAKGVLFYSLDELEKEIAEYPNLFTDDLKILIVKYNEEIRNFLKHIVKN